MAFNNVNVKLFFDALKQALSKADFQANMRNLDETGITDEDAKLSKRPPSWGDQARDMCW